MQLFNYLYTCLMVRMMRDEESEKGQTLVEYGLIIALLSIVVIGVLGLLGDELIIVFNKVKNELAGTNATP